MAARRKRRGGLIPALLAAAVLLVFLYLGGGDLETGLNEAMDALEDAGAEISLGTEAPGETELPAGPDLREETEPSAETEPPAGPELPTEDEPAAPPEGTLTLTVLEVGKADCLVLQCEGESMIVDGGNEGDEDYILEHLEKMGLSGFEVLVNTHPHEDHLGSLDAVIRAYPVEQAYISPYAHTTKSYENLLTALEEEDVPTAVPEPGDSFALGGATFTVLSPDPDADYDDEINNWSIVLLAEYGDVRFLLMGDAETPVETDLLDAGLDLRADVLKVGHHGSSTSSKRAFLEAVDPDYACITCDYTEKAGAPHEEVAERLDDLGVTVLRTDLQGVLTVSTDGSTVNVTTEREAA